VDLKSNNFRKAAILTVIFHLCLLALFFFVKVKIDIRLGALTEIAFISGEATETPSPLTSSIDEAAARETQPEPIHSQPVDIPERRMLEPIEPEIHTAPDSREKISSEDEIVATELSHQEWWRQRISDVIAPPGINEKQTAESAAIPFSGDKKIPPSLPLKLDGTDSSTPYLIEGQAATRTVTYKVIPEYPDNLQKQAVVKISFTVLPNGRIGEMIPLIKADPSLEKLTLDALRQWRFNPLAESESPRIETGVITFRYILK